MPRKMTYAFKVCAKSESAPGKSSGQRILQKRKNHLTVRNSYESGLLKREGIYNNGKT